MVGIKIKRFKSKSGSPLIGAVILVAITISVAYMAGSILSTLVQKEASSKEIQSLSSLSSATLSVALDSLECKNGKIKVLARLLGVPESYKEKGVKVIVRTDSEKIAEGVNKNAELMQGVLSLIEVPLDKIIKGRLKSFQLCTFSGVCFEAKGKNLLPSCCISYYAKNLTAGVFALSRGENHEYVAISDDGRLLFISPDGRIEKAVKISGGDMYLVNIYRTENNDYIAVGYTGSFGAGGSDALLIKLNSSGYIEWAKTYGTSSDETVYSLKITEDDGYIVVGKSAEDILVFKVDSSGNLQWAKKYGGSNSDFATAIEKAHDNGYVVAGVTSSFGDSYGDFLLFKIDENGDVEWAKKYDINASGAESVNFLSSLLKREDGYTIYGGSLFPFIAEFDTSGNVKKIAGYKLLSYAFPSSIVRVGNGYVASAYNFSLWTMDAEFWLLKFNSTLGIEWIKRWKLPYCNMGLLTILLYSSYTYRRNMILDNDVIMASAVGQTSDSFYTMILRTDENGNIPGCNLLENAQLSEFSMSYTQETVSLSVSGISLTESEITSALSVSPIQIEEKNVCYKEVC